MKSGKYLIYFGYLAIILLPNGDILNYLLSGTPVVIWKQLLSLVMTFLAVQCYGKLRKNSSLDSSVRYDKLMFLMVFSVFFLSISSVVQGVSIYRLSYSLFSYVGFISFFVFIRLLIIKKCINKFFRVAIIVGFFCAFGLIYDYFFPTFDFLPRSGDIGLQETLYFGYLRRASFLFGASTTIYPFLSFTLFAAIVEIIYGSKKIYKIIAYSLLFISPLAIFFTGSRSQLLLLMLFLLGTFIWAIISFKKPALLLIPILIILFSSVGITVLSSKVIQWESLTERYVNFSQMNAEGNDTRIKNWKEGVELFTSSPGFETLFGIGLGRSLGMVDDGMPITPHYESSFFQAFSEGGLLGLLLRYYPPLLLFLVLFRKVRQGYPLASLLMLWTFLYCFSVSVSPTAGAYHTQIVFFATVAFGIDVDRLEYCLKENRNRCRLYELS